jgi:phosphoglycerol transferase MdoB-like AlkP superfamily enzyme
MFRKLFNHRFSLVLAIACLSLITGALTRIALFAGTTSSGVTLAGFAGSMVIGLLFDLTVTSYIILPFVLHIWVQNNFIYHKRMFPWVAGSFVMLLGLLLFTHLIPRDYSPEVYRVLTWYVFARMVIYIILYFFPHSYRLRWREGVLYAATVLAVFLLLLNAVSEWFFWQEFGTRYNFIAVDYLVYTTEVLGNINESYPIAYIIPGLAISAIVLTAIARKSVQITISKPLNFTRRSLVAIIFLMMPVLAYFSVQEKWRHFSKNEYSNALAGNGIFEFATAFNQNELDFYHFYQTLPDDTAFQVLRKQLEAPYGRFVSNDPYNIERMISYPEPETKLNVVLISVESLSAGFMRTYGGTKNITPYLDSLAQYSISFNNLYASGTRTVRGLEALSLSIPPTPGQSIVKRPENGQLFSLGNVFRSKGYRTQYIYGGYSYFDNMKEFFSHNGYDVIDRTAIPHDSVHYENIWGVADEDLFSLSMHTLDANYASGVPFFTHIMTVSNHRPFTYPKGRIDILPSSQTREGAVKYTDYAIHRFLLEASHKKWFDSTVFVVVADHCAGSAGSVELPVTGYHIPMLIYAPALFQPRQVDILTAQIDVAPTILGLLHMQYRSKFFGQDVLNTPREKQRAFISTYQGLGYLRNKELVIQSPIKSVKEYQPDFVTGSVRESKKDSLVTQAIAYYQCASWLLKHKKQTELTGDGQSVTHLSN